MKNLALLFLCLFATMSFAQAEICTPEQFNILNKAEGPDSERLRSILMLETPNFKCEVTTTHFAFPDDCGRFTYVKLDYKVQVGATKIKAVVHDGSISCRRFKKSELVKVVIKE